MSSNQEKLNVDDPQSNSYGKVSLSKLDKLRNAERIEFIGWLQREVNFWKEIVSFLQQQHQLQQSQRLGSRVSALVLRDTQEYLELINTFQKKFVNDIAEPDWGDLDSFKDAFFTKMFSYNLPQHDDPHADEFKDSCHAGASTSAVYTFRLLSNYPQGHYLRGYEEGISRNLKELTDCVDDKAEKTLLEIEGREGDVAKSIKNAEEELTRIVAAATSAIALSEPVKFWEDRKGVHNSNAKKYGKYATISAVIFAVTLGLIVIYEYMSGVTHTWFGYDFTLPKSLSGIAIILLISTAGIWSTRIFVKLMMANLTLETESIERATMIKTFVAMKAAEAKMAQEAELLFYTTLFRPSNNVINEESTAPEFGKILDAILKVKPDKPA